MTSRFFAVLLTALLGASSQAFAQDTECTITLSRYALGRNQRILVVYYRLDPPGLCRVTPLVLQNDKPFEGAKVKEVTSGSDRYVEVEFQDLLSTPRKGSAGNEVVFEIQINNQPQILAIRLEPVPTPAPVRPISIGAAWFGSVEPRVSTPSLGSQQAAGIMARLAFPAIVGGIELGFEGEVTTREAIDSELFSLSSERRLLKDNFFAITAGYEAAAGSRLTFTPTAGFGFGLLNTRRLRYTLSGNSVAVAEDDASGNVPMFTAGVDVRVRLVARLRAIGGYRAHVLFGGEDELLQRGTQHRFTIGLQFDAGGVR